MKKGEEMNVTRQTLRDMILAELGAVDEDAVVTRTSARGVPSQDLASMSTEDIEGILRQKAGGLSSKMAEFISAMVDAGWDRDQFIRNLAGMDDDILVTLLAPAMRESYDRAVQLLAEAIGTPGPAVDGDDGTLMTVGQFRRLVREALDYDPAYRRIAERLLGAGLPDDAFVPIMGLYQDTGAADASGFEEWLSDEGDRMSDTFKETFNRRPQDVSKLYIAYVTDYSRSGWDERLSGMREWLETVDPDSTDLGTDSLVVTGARLRGPMDESVLMTVGQFRDMVKEAMEAGIFGNIEKHDTGVNKDDTSRISWGVNLDTKYEGGSKYDVNTFSEYIGNKYGGVNGALDNQRLRRIKQAARAAGMVPEYVDMETNTEINPPPSGPPRDVAVEAIKAEIDKYINKKEPGKELENPNIDIPNIDIDAHNIFTHWKYFGVPIDYLDPNDVEGAWQSYTTNESTLMTVGQFRRLVREAAGGSRPVPLNEIEEVPYAAINGLLQALNRHGPWESTGKMEDAVADALTISQWVTDAADGYAKRHEVNASDLLDDLRSELNDRGSRGPGLDKVSITDYTPPDPHPSEELYQAEGSLDDDIEEISDRLDRQRGHESYQDFADELQLIRTGNMTFADRRQHLTRLELDMSTEGID